MKLTKTRLKQLIKEELVKFLREDDSELKFSEKHWSEFYQVWETEDLKKAYIDAVDQEMNTPPISKGDAAVDRWLKDSQTRDLQLKAMSAELVKRGENDFLDSTHAW